MEYRMMFTGAGRRVELIQSFREAAERIKVDLKIFGADMSMTAPALAFCDYTRIVCGMRDEAYIPTLLELCKKDQIDLLIPTIDTDLLVLSESKELFETIGTKVLVSQPDKIAICRDKNDTAKFFEQCGLKAPHTVNDYRKYNGSYPCFIKPKDGSSSVNAFKVENEAELKLYAKKIGDYIIQPFIEGTEYTVDIFCDYNGQPIYITPRIRVAVRSGEVLKTEISQDDRLIAESQKVIEHLKPCGPITVQLIRETQTEEDYYIEINPRYGGGAPLSMKAGADSAEATLRFLMGQTLKYMEKAAEDGAMYCRFDQSVRVK
jgi:carbamoylphosphate synthase large subunit